MHKINRIGEAQICALTRAATAPAIVYTGSAIAQLDTNITIVNAINGAEDGVTFEAIPTGTFTHTTATKMAYGQQMSFDIPFGDSIAVECWGQLQGVFGQSCIAGPIAGHLIDLATTNMELEILTDVVYLGPHSFPAASVSLDQRIITYHSKFVARRTSALPFKLAHGVLLQNPSADVASCLVRNMSFGYKTLADQYAFQYFDPAR